MGIDTLGCGELAEITGGRLQLGAMPPLGGRLEPAGPIVTRREEIVPGCLFWALDDDRGAGARHLEEAYCRGAKGVVVGGRRAAPFGGCFAIEVDDAAEALCRLGRWRRSSFEGRLVLLGPGLGAAAPLRDCLDVRAAEIGDLPSAALRLLALPPRGVAALELAGEKTNSEIDEISHLCCPHVVCIYVLPRGEQPAGESLSDELLAALPDDGRLVEVAPHGASAAAPSPRRLLVEAADCWRLTARCGRQATLIRKTDEDFDRRRLPALLACWGVSQALGCDVPWEIIERACRAAPASEDRRNRPVTTNE